jgi:phytoene/squalene synthetase
MKNDKMLTKNFLRRFVLNEINVPVTGGEYLSSTDSHNVSKVHEVLQGLQEILNVFPGHEQEIREMIDALRAMLQADEGNPTGELGKGRTGRPDSPMR